MMKQVTDRNGLKWFDGGLDTDDHLSFGGHEPQIVEIAKSLLPEGGVFLDVGAHVGLYTLNLANKASKVYAIEANERTYEVLKANVEANADQISAEVHCANVAAWDMPAYLTLRDENGKETGGSTMCVPSMSPTKLIGTPLDDILPSGLLFDLVKIDVEGAEGHVLRGMAQIIARSTPVLLIEMHDKVYDLPDVRKRVLRFLESMGYRWSENLSFSVSYYIVAKPDVPEPFEIEVVKAGDVDNPEPIEEFTERVKREIEEKA